MVCMILFVFETAREEIPFAVSCVGRKYSGDPLGK